VTPNADMRYRALDALDDRVTAEVAAELRVPPDGALRDPDDQVRRLAVRVFGRLRDV
jgi:hypothetical protein